MRLHVVSDLHVEFAAFELPTVDADVVVLAGDVGQGTTGIRLARRWSRGRTVLFVAGNHEYYGHALPALTDRMRAEAEGSAVQVLGERRGGAGGRALPRLHPVERLHGRGRG